MFCWETCEIAKRRNWALSKKYVFLQVPAMRKWPFSEMVNFHVFPLSQSHSNHSHAWAPKGKSWFYQIFIRKSMFWSLSWQPGWSIADACMAAGRAGEVTVSVGGVAVGAQRPGHSRNVVNDVCATFHDPSGLIIAPDAHVKKCRWLRLFN